MQTLLTVSYDGTNYHGFAKQDNLPTVQGEIENALLKLYKQEVKILYASRTDAGVHALGQRASFSNLLNIPTKSIPKAINSYLPDDIVVFSAIESEIHPQYDAKNKTYRYSMDNSQFKNPLMRNYQWHIYKHLDVQKMQEAAKYIVGEYDFSAFCSAGATVTTKVRTIYSLNVVRDGSTVYFDINGNGFLYNMVRIIAGTLVNVGLGRIEPSELSNIIESKDRRNAGTTAPPQGLTLIHINY